MSDPGASRRPPPMPSRQRAVDVGLSWEVRRFFRTTDLLTTEPIEERLSLALVVQVRTQLRKVYDREEEVNPARVPALVAASSISSRPFQPSSWQCAIAVHDDAPRRCSACRYGPPACVACAGAAKIVIPGSDGNPLTVSCPGCKGTGHIECQQCDGGRIVQRVTIRTITEEVSTLDRRFLPELPYALAWLLDDALTPYELKEELLVDLLKPSSASLGSYRSSETQEAPHFFGIDASSVLPPAKAFAERSAQIPDAVHFELKAYAVPVALLRYPHHDVLIFGGSQLEVIGLAS